MAGTIKITTDQVEAIASNLDNNNKKLRETLEESRSSIKSLNSTWQGEASQATIAAYESFSAKFFQSYYDIIDSYVKFLRQNVAIDYTSTETQNITDVSKELMNQ